MKRVMHHQEEPFSSGSALAQFRVYQSARAAGIKVLLDGQGADEVLGGYHKYYQWYWQELYRAKQLRSSGEKEKAQLLGIKQSFGMQHKIAALVPQFAAALWQSSKAKKAAQQRDLHPDFIAANKQQFYYSTPATFDLNGALYFSTFVHGLEELLRLADRNSMAHAVEVRLPFLSHELVEFLFSLPPYFKIQQGWTKWLLRKSVSHVLPQDITWRKDKVGFEPPQQIWMEQEAVKEAMYEGKRALVHKGILDQQVLQKKIKPHGAHAANTQDWKYWSASFLFDTD
jgi:asparagine synthase (glutamine-hydrolysing)